MKRFIEAIKAKQLLCAIFFNIHHIKYQNGYIVSLYLKESFEVDVVRYDIFDEVLEFVSQYEYVYWVHFLISIMKALEDSLSIEALLSVNNGDINSDKALDESLSIGERDSMNNDCTKIHININTLYSNIHKRSINERIRSFLIMFVELLHKKRSIPFSEVQYYCSCTRFIISKIYEITGNNSMCMNSACHVCYSCLIALYNKEKLEYEHFLQCSYDWRKMKQLLELHEGTKEEADQYLNDLNEYLLPEAIQSYYIYNKK